MNHEIYQYLISIIKLPPLSKSLSKDKNEDANLIVPSLEPVTLLPTQERELELMSISFFSLAKEFVKQRKEIRKSERKTQKLKFLLIPAKDIMFFLKLIFIVTKIILLRQKKHKLLRKNILKIDSIKQNLQEIKPDVKNKRGKIFIQQRKPNEFS